MTVAIRYFIDGLGVREIAEAEGLPPDEVRDTLKGIGINIGAGDNVDAITQIIRENGFSSFRDYVAKNGFHPIKNQFI